MQEPVDSNYFQEERAQKDKIIGPSIQSKASNSYAPESTQSTLSTSDTKGRIPSKGPRLVWHPPWPGGVTHSLTAQKLHKSCPSPPHSLICVGQRTLGSSQLCDPSASSGSVLFWSRSKPHVEVKSCPAKPIKPLVANREGTYIVGGGLSGDIYLWEVASGRHAHYRVVTCLEFSNDDLLLRILTKKRKGSDDAKDGNLEENGWYLSGGKWGYLRKDCFNQTLAKLTACDYHRGLDMMVVGFSNGVFRYQLLDFVCIHLLSIPKEKITTAVFNETGNCVTLGLVVEWKLGYGVCHRQRMEGEQNVVYSRGHVEKAVSNLVHMGKKLFIPQLFGDMLEKALQIGTCIQYQIIKMELKEVVIAPHLFVKMLVKARYNSLGDFWSIPICGKNLFEGVYLGAFLSMSPIVVVVKFLVEGNNSSALPCLNSSFKIIGEFEDGILLVEARYPALLFTQQLTTCGKKFLALLLLGILSLRGIVSYGGGKIFMGLRQVVKGVTKRIGRGMHELAAKVDEYARGMMGSLGSTLFEELGLYYIGPVDGHNIEDLICVLQEVASQDSMGLVLVHVVTEETEGPEHNRKSDISDSSNFCPLSSRIHSLTYGDCFVEALAMKAKKDKDIVIVHAGMQMEPTLQLLQKKIPNKFFDMEIAAVVEIILKEVENLLANDVGRLQEADTAARFVEDGKDEFAKEVFDQMSSPYVVSFKVICMGLARHGVKDGNFDWITDDELEVNNFQLQRKRGSQTAPCGQGASMGDGLSQSLNIQGHGLWALGPFHLQFQFSMYLDYKIANGPWALVLLPCMFFVLA